MLDASVHTVTGLDMPTPSSGPSMSPNTVPSEAFNADLSLSQVSLGGDDETLCGRRHYDEQGEYEPGTDPVADAVHDLVRSVAEDSVPRLVIAESCGVSASIAVNHVVPLLHNTRNTHEVVLVDLHGDDVIASVCGAVFRNPTISSLVLANSGRCAGLTKDAIGHIASLVYNCRHLVALSLMNTLFAHVHHAMQVLGEAVSHSSSLKVLNLEANAIDDESVLPLAQGLAGQRSIVEAYFDSNTLSYKGMDIMSEVMMYNETLEVLSLNKNLVRCVTDLWEGYFIHEQCRVNRELAILGKYTMSRHQEWPSLWRRKMRRMWAVFDHLTKAQEKNTGKAQLTGRDWESVMQCLDARGYVEQQVKLWMKLEPPQPAAAQIWRHT
eukprot:TRINITY_DN35561_c0_g1_i1.p1 TRINITY_DN35561_c0_g1~~TRINITY_DN35561_c0_g1_i1.p1  ORF type:complete len:381 (+),score=159.72 TRINITY_DN35561_c0_g1_i1:44-1186(+)